MDFTFFYNFPSHRVPEEQCTCQDKIDLYLAEKKKKAEEERDITESDSDSDDSSDALFPSSDDDSDQHEA